MTYEKANINKDKMTAFISVTRKVIMLRTR